MKTIGFITPVTNRTTANIRNGISDTGFIKHARIRIFLDSSSDTTVIEKKPITRGDKFSCSVNNESMAEDKWRTCKI